MNLMKWFLFCAATVALWAVSAKPVAATNILNVNTINGAAGTPSTEWTGQTFAVTAAGTPYTSAGVGDMITVPYFVPGLAPAGLTGPANPFPTINATPAAYVDRNHTFADGGTFFGLTYPPMEGYLKGDEYIMQQQNNRTQPALQLDVTVANPSIVYLLIENRMGDGNGLDPPTFDATHMPWVPAGGWLPVKTGQNHLSDITLPDEIAIDESQDGLQAKVPNPNPQSMTVNTVDNFFSIYSKQVPAGTFSLYEADAGGIDMYSVVIKAVPEPTTGMLLLLTAPLAGARLRRKR